MGVQERREREKEQRRNDILDAAEQVFFEKGLSLSTMDDVAEAAELSKGTLYLYFNSKQELYLGIHQRGFAKMHEMFTTAAGMHKQGVDKIRAIGNAYYEFSKKYPDYYKAIMYFEGSVLDFTSDSEMIELYHRDGKQVMQFVQNVLSEGIDDGTIVTDFQVERLAFILWGQISGVIQIISKISQHPDKQIQFNPFDLFDDYMQFMGKLLINPGKEDKS